MSDYDLPKSTLDFAGMGALRGQAQRREEKATQETATQFEAMFIQMMLKSMRDAVNTSKSGLMHSDHEDTFTEMYDRELSVQLAKRNTLGVADMLVKSINRSNDPGPAYKAKAEPIAIKPEVKAIPVSEQKSLQLIRPEKFMIKPRAVTPTSSTGAE